MDASYTLNRTIGIIGGMGPLATSELFRKIILLNNVSKDWHHPRVLIDSNTQIPSRVRHFLYSEPSPLPKLIETVNSLHASGAEVLLMPCVTAHYFHNELVRKTGRNIVNLIDELIGVIWIDRPTVKTIGVLGTEYTCVDTYQGQPTNSVLIEALRSADIEVISPNPAQLIVVRQLIENVKRGRVTQETQSKFDGIISDLLSSGADSIVLACSELTLLNNDLRGKERVYDSVEILAKAGLKYAARFEGNHFES